MDVRSLNAILIIIYPQLKSWQLCALLNILDVKTIWTRQETLGMTGTRTDAPSVTVQVKDLTFKNESISITNNFRWGFYCLYKKRVPTSSSKLSSWGHINRWKWLLPGLQSSREPWDMFSQPTEDSLTTGPWNTSEGPPWLQKQWSHHKLGNLQWQLSIRIQIWYRWIEKKLTIMINYFYLRYPSIQEWLPLLSSFRLQETLCSSELRRWTHCSDRDPGAIWMWMSPVQHKSQFWQ